ncbi:MAG: site-specific DNA-methyltransferase [Bacteroidota bacterium]
MATGITANNWTKETQIITDEVFTGDFNYEIKYEGKSDENEIISSKPKNKYELITGANQENSLYFGDNLDVMSMLIHQKNLKGKVKLVYIDPPYGTNSVFQSRHQKDSYKDDLIGSHFIEFLRRRLILLRELLSDEGSIYIHLDGNMTFQIKVIMDEIFGAKNFRGFITRKKCSNKNSTRKTYGNISDYIIFYSKSENYTWHRATDAWTDDKILKEYPCIDEKSGRRFKKVPIHAPGIRNGETGKEWRGMLPPPGKHWQYTPSKLDEFDALGEIYWSSTGNPRRKAFLDEDKGIPVQDIWLDVQDSLNQSIKITGYPTEKNPYLLERIIKASSNVNDIVLDCFAGSGTTLDLAEQFGRKWIGIDNSSESIRNIFKRFYNGLEEMGDYVNKPNLVNNTINAQSTLFEPQMKYNSKIKERKNFNFYSDSRFKDIILDALEEYIEI